MNMLKSTKGAYFMNVEFGEKIKRLREEKGMTQQTMADKLYVTRQAVSRWECGARFPDLLTAKKVAQILGTSIDELVSGEELKKNIESEQVVARTVPNILQTLLYGIVAVVYVLILCNAIPDYIRMFDADYNHLPAYQFGLSEVAFLVKNSVMIVLAVLGVVLSMRNKLNSRLVGWIMSAPYILAAIEFILNMVEMSIKQNGNMDIWGWGEAFVVPILFAACIIIFFSLKERRIPYIVIWIICLAHLYYVVRYGVWTIIASQLYSAWSTRLIHSLARICMIGLMGYQAYVWDKKKKIAYKE